MKVYSRWKQYIHGKKVLSNDLISSSDPTVCLPPSGPLQKLYDDRRDPDRYWIGRSPSLFIASPLCYPLAVV